MSYVGIRKIRHKQRFPTEAACQFPVPVSYTHLDVYKRQVQAHLHEDLEVFGSGMGEEDKTWNAVIRQALIGGYLSKDVENYGLLKVTEEGHKFLKKPKSFKITEDNDFEETEEEVFDPDALHDEASHIGCLCRKRR